MYKISLIILISTGLLTFSIFTMKSRYETIRFSTFENGETQRDFSDNPNLAFSNKLQLNDNRKVKLAPLFEKYSIDDSYFYATDEKIWGEYNNTGTIYFFIVTKVGGIDHAVLYSSTGSAAPTLRKDFGAGLPEQIIFADDHIVIQFINDTSGVHEWYWSDTPTVAGSWTNIAALNDIIMIDWARVDGIIYFTTTIPGGTLATKKADIYVSDNNGESFTLYQSSAPVQKLVESSGFLYGYITKGILYVLENNIWRIVDRSIGYGTIHDINGLLRIYGSDNLVREFDGISMRFKRELSIPGRPYYAGDTNNGSFFQYFDDSETYFVYFLDKDNVLMNFAKFASMPESDQFWGIILSTENVYFALTSDDTIQKVEFHSTYNEKYESQGDFESTIVDKGEISPMQLILKHDPLPANTTVKVSYDFNKTGTYTLVITSDTDGAIKKVYTFANGTKIDFAQFKIELETTDPTKTPDNISLDFIYQPVGLTNAQ